MSENTIPTIQELLTKHGGDFHKAKFDLLERQIILLTESIADRDHVAGLQTKIVALQDEQLVALGSTLKGIRALIEKDYSKPNACQIHALLSKVGF